MGSPTFKKIFLFLLLLFFSFSSIPTLAQNEPTPTGAPASRNNIILQKQKAIQENTGLESWTNEAMGSNFTALFLGLNGSVPEEVFDSMESGEEEEISYSPGGAIGDVNQRIASLYTPPASGIEYLAQVKDNFLGKPVYAQDSTFQQLQFLLPIWRSFRNIIYVLATLLFIIVGLMIILRVKVSPQAVITLQSAIPQIITTLILVTFSYAIAGLIIDFTNLIQGIFMSALFSASGKNLTTDYLFESQFWHQTWINGLWDDIQKLFVKYPTLDYSFSSLTNMDAKIFRGLARRLSPRLTTGVFLGKLIGKITVGFMGDLSGGIGGAILPLITSILVFIWSIKLFFGLLKCYLMILFKIIIAPLEIGMGSIPNSKTNFSSWFIDILSNAITFPVVAIFIVLANVIVDVFEKGAQAGGSLWMPGLIDATRLFSHQDRAYVSLGAALGLVCLSLMSKLPDLIPAAIKNMKGADFGKAIGENLNLKNAPIIGGAIKTTQAGVEKAGTEIVSKYVQGPVKDKFTEVSTRVGFGKRKSNPEPAAERSSEENKSGFSN